MVRELPEWVKEGDKNKKKESLIKKIIIGVSTLVILAIIGGVGLLIHNANNKKNTPMAVGNETPKNIAKDGSLHIIDGGESNAKATADAKSVRTVMYFDPMCPGCGAADRALGETYSKLSKDKTIDLYMNPVAFLDRSSTDQYSTRAINAIITVSEKDPKHVLKFINKLYEEGTQPHEATAYVPVKDSDLAKTAEKVGVSSSVTKDFEKHSYMKWISDHTNRLNTNSKTIFPEGISTPTILMGGKNVDASGDPTGFTQVPLNGNDPILSTFTKTLSEVQSKEGK